MTIIRVITFKSEKHLPHYYEYLRLKYFMNLFIFYIILLKAELYVLGQLKISIKAFVIQSNNQ